MTRKQILKYSGIGFGLFMVFTLGVDYGVNQVKSYGGEAECAGLKKTADANEEDQATPTPEQIAELISEKPDTESEESPPRYEGDIIDEKQAVAQAEPVIPVLPLVQETVPEPATPPTRAPASMKAETKPVVLEPEPVVPPAREPAKLTVVAPPVRAVEPMVPTVSVADTAPYYSVVLGSFQSEESVKKRAQYFREHGIDTEVSIESHRNLGQVFVLHLPPVRGYSGAKKAAQVFDQLPDKVDYYFVVVKSRPTN